MRLFLELLGWIGFLCYLFPITTLIKGKWNSHQPVYHWYNIVGGLFVAHAAFYAPWAVRFINLAHV